MYSEPHLIKVHPAPADLVAQPSGKKTGTVAAASQAQVAGLRERTTSSNANQTCTE